MFNEILNICILRHKSRNKKISKVHTNFLAVPISLIEQITSSKDQSNI